jgi:hypothetical protein
LDTVGRAAPDGLAKGRRPAVVARVLQVNRERAQRVMRKQHLLQRHQLWHLDMTSVWVAEHGWTYLNAAVDCCTRELVGWSLELRCRTGEAIDLVDHAVVLRLPDGEGHVVDCATASGHVIREGGRAAAASLETAADRLEWSAGGARSGAWDLGSDGGSGCGW